MSALVESYSLTLNPIDKFENQKKQWQRGAKLRPICLRRAEKPHSGQMEKHAKKYLHNSC